MNTTLKDVIECY